jgi:TRAP-type C4-dicarboxylate transport system permease small subunit
MSDEMRSECGEMRSETGKAEPTGAAPAAAVSDDQDGLDMRVEYMPGVFLLPRPYIPKYEKAGMWVAYLSDWLSIAAIFFLLCMTFLDVTLRTLFSAPISGVYDWTRYVMVFVAVFGMPLCAMNDEHVCIDVLTKNFPIKVQDALAWLNYALVVFYFGLIITESWKQAGFNKLLGQSNAGVPWPTYPFCWFVSVGFACMLAVIFVKIINHARGIK